MLRMQNPTNKITPKSKTRTEYQIKSYFRKRNKRRRVNKRCGGVELWKIFFGENPKSAR